VSFGFLKDFWEDLMSDFLRFTLEFHENGSLTKGINNTSIVLIPKRNNHIKLNDYRLISILSGMYVQGAI